MLELTDWFNRHLLSNRPWLMLGKGPTFDRLDEFNVSGFNLIGLNHVVARRSVDVAHVIDIDVIGDCAETIEANCRWLLMPRWPHLRSELGNRPLEDWFSDFPVLRALDDSGRLVWYNLADGRQAGRSPLIECRSGFSSEAVLRILGLMGVRVVRTLGIDGGRSYANAFEHLSASTLLANGASSFDLQRQRLDLVACEHEIDLRPLVDPLRIYVGTDESQIVAYRVLEYSIRKSASVPVEISAMADLPTPIPRDPANRPRTGFSFSRFMIPALAGYQGRALYLDADMLVFGDVAELAELEFGPHRVLCTPPDEAEGWKMFDSEPIAPRLAVMLLDCGRLGWDIDEIVRQLDEGRFDYRELMDDLCILPRDEIAETIPPAWNHLERFDPSSTKLLHYTVVPTQPWKSDANPLAALWMTSFTEALEAGAVPPEEVEDAAHQGYVKPALVRLLAHAPGRRSPTTSASLDLERARRRIVELEATLSWTQRSLDWRIGHVIGRTLRAPRKLAGLARGQQFSRG